MEIDKTKKLASKLNMNTFLKDTCNILKLALISNDISIIHKKLKKIIDSSVNTDEISNNENIEKLIEEHKLNTLISDKLRENLKDSKTTKILIDFDVANDTIDVIEFKDDELDDLAKFLFKEHPPLDKKDV